MKLTGSGIAQTTINMDSSLYLYISTFHPISSHICIFFFFPSKMAYYKKVLMKIILLLVVLLSMNMAKARMPLWISEPHKPSK